MEQGADEKWKMEREFPYRQPDIRHNLKGHDSKTSALVNAGKFTGARESLLVLIGD